MASWCRVVDDEFPPEGVIVWTSDGKQVFQGHWKFAGPGVPLAESAWSDADGNPLRVTHWLPIEESRMPPSPPA